MTGSTRHAAGFTLLEATIVLAVVAVLASIVYPSYQRHLTESRRTEAKALLIRVAGQLERCHTLHGDYTRCPISYPVRSESDLYRIVDPGSAMTPSSYLLSAHPQGVQAERDRRCGVFTLAHTGERRAGEAGCW